MVFDSSHLAFSLQPTRANRKLNAENVQLTHIDLQHRSIYYIYICIYLLYIYIYMCVCMHINKIHRYINKCVYIVYIICMHTHANTDVLQNSVFFLGGVGNNVVCIYIYIYIYIYIHIYICLDCLQASCRKHSIPFSRCNLVVLGTTFVVYLVWRAYVLGHGICDLASRKRLTGRPYTSKPLNPGPYTSTRI